MQFHGCYGKPQGLLSRGGLITVLASKVERGVSTATTVPYNTLRKTQEHSMLKLSGNCTSEHKSRIRH